MKQAYQYLFYTLYKFWEKVSIPRFWSDAKAIFSIIALEIFLISSLAAYYRVFINRYSHIGESIWDVIIVVVIVCIPNYFIFSYNDKWKNIVHNYDKHSNENKRGGIIVASVIAIVIVNFIFAFYLFFQK